jgi:hypothetical protein
MQQMSSTITSAAFMTGSIFPNLTLPQFEISGGYVDGMGGIMSVAFAPHVKTEKRDEWESYAELHQEWIAESLRLKQVHPGHRDPLHGTTQDHEHDRRLDEPPAIPPIRNAIWRWDNGKRVTEESLPGQMFAPLWQSSPASAADVNVNLLSDNRVASLYNSMIATRQSVISNDFPIEDLFDFLFDPEEKPQKDHPHAFLMEPVYADFEENSEIVGFLLGVTIWKNLFNRLIPEGANGIVCVVKDTCGGTMAFELNGPVATYMGDEDLHDKAFHEYEVRMPIEQYETQVEGLCAIFQVHGDSPVQHARYLHDCGCSCFSRDRHRDHLLRQVGYPTARKNHEVRYPQRQTCRVAFPGKCPRQNYGQCGECWRRHQREKQVPEQ